MATLLLSVAGAAIGGSFGGSIAGLAGGAIGKAIGATVGAAIDQRLTGSGSEPVETGRVERFRVMGASEGATLPRVYGRYRVAGQVIWSSNFLEHVDSRRVGGKGGGQSQKVREYSYSISLAIALCEGEVARVGRIWADGQRLDQSGITWRLHDGSEEQIPDPVIAAIEGADEAPAYRGTAYVVFENLDLTPFGNRIPQFNFEVVRRPEHASPELPRPPALDVRGVALVPGTGEYALATTPIYVEHGKGRTIAANVNNDRGQPDLVVSLDQLEAELPAAKSVSLVVSWFGDDLRCDRCRLRPAVEQAEKDSRQMPWRVSGVDRFGAKVVSQLEGRPVFGGTPSDQSVVQAIRHLRDSGLSVMFYPFILMDIVAGNALVDPWTGQVGQPPVPWRGRITLSAGPGAIGSVDQTPAAATEVEAFFGSARAADFRIRDGGVDYEGPAEDSYRRFVLHYAHLCSMAGGVEAFCIGSEMRALTQIRDSRQGYPAVRALCELAEEVRAILGPDAKIGYAADWSEYFGHQPNDGSGDVIFHLDPLWANPAIDFVGIDNYMPLSDWRDGAEHLDAGVGSIYDLEYLTGNVAGGEGFDWFYADAGDRDRQVRSPISDGAFGEHWTFRYKDIAGWWSNAHRNRIGGMRDAAATPWRPRSKPVWFTELGCPAVDKGTNQPNVFFDPKSSESYLPYFSSGSNDDFMQYRYLQAMFAYWNSEENNPSSDIYPGKMVDMAHAHVWAWDARPWPDFPDRRETWVDGSNYSLGHWINGRASVPSLAEVVTDVCARSGVHDIGVSALFGRVTGYSIGAVESARQSLQPLMMTYGFDSFASDGAVVFANRGRSASNAINPGEMVVSRGEAAVAAARSAPTEAPGRLELEFVRSDMDYLPGAAQAISPLASEADVSRSSVPVVLSQGLATAVAERWLAESRVSRETIQFTAPPSRLDATAGDVITVGFGGHASSYRIDRIEELGPRSVTAVRIEPSLYDAPVIGDAPSRSVALPAQSPVYAEFLDLPLLTGDENLGAPHVAVTKYPWAGAVAVYSASDDFGYVLNREIFRPATLGQLVDPLPAATAGLWSEATVRVRVDSGVLQSHAAMDVLNGANAAAVRAGGTGEWEVFQFANATLVGPGEYVLSGLLRGQAGTDAVMPSLWPMGADFVLLDAAATQVEQTVGGRGLERHYRIGPSSRPYDDASYLHLIKSFPGAGLRPYRPAHLAAVRKPGGEIEISWVRRTRVDGDSWEGSDVPLGEEVERYRLRVINGEDEVARELETGETTFVYSHSAQTQDGFNERFQISVAQVSMQFGDGPYATIQSFG